MLLEMMQNIVAGRSPISPEFHHVLVDLFKPTRSSATDAWAVSSRSITRLPLRPATLGIFSSITHTVW